MNKAYQAPEMITEDQLRAVREKSRSAWSTILLPMVPVVALIVGGVIYWLATTSDTNKIFGPVAERSTSNC